MKIRRDIASIPERTAEATWETVTELVTGDDSVDVEQLHAASSVMCSLIADEYFDDYGMTLIGKSHRLVIYCQFMAAARDLGQSIQPLSWNPTAESWELFVPCPEVDLNWVGDALKERAPRIRPYPAEEEPPFQETANKKESTNGETKIDWSMLEQL